MQNDLDIIVIAEDKASSILKKIQGSVDAVWASAGKASKQFADFAERNQKGLQSVAVASGIAFTALGLGVKRAVEESNKFENALLGLKSIVLGTGNDFGQAEEFLKSFTADGLVSTADAATSLKNLLARGFWLDEARVIMDRFKDSASFGRQASLWLGEAIKGATEGLKNENSVLVDNAGVTRNVSKMWEDYAKKLGISVVHMTMAQKRQAELNGIIKETQHQVGDAAKYTDTFAGRQAKLTAETTKLYVAIWDGLKPILAKLLAVVTPVITKIAEFATKHKTLTGTVILLTGALIALALAMTTIGLIYPNLVAGFWLLTKVFLATKTAIFTSLIPAIKALYVSLGPVGWIILILTTAISAFALAWHNNFLGIREITGKVLTWIATNVQKLGPVWEGVIRGVLTMTNFAIKALNLLPWVSIKTIENVEGKAKSASAKLVQFTAFSANYVNDKWVKTGTNIEAKMDDVGSVTKSAEEALNKLNTAGKGTNEALKKMKEKAEEALGAIMDKGKDTKKAIEEIQEKIKNSTDDWKKYKQEGVDALREISLEMKKLRDEAEKINLDFGINKEQKLGERMVEVLNEINDIQKDIAGEEDAGRRAEMEQKLNALLAERTFIQSNASQNAIDEAMAYASLSEAQKIVVDLEKEKGKALDENKAKMDALVEKRMVLEAQANQASMDQQKIFTEIKDWIVSASIENEKGERIALHDQEAINLAFEVAQKQEAMRVEMEDLRTQLESKLALQQENLNATKTAYEAFNKYLRDDTKATANEMIASLASVNAMLKDTIALKAKAGIASSTPIEGAKAEGGRVDAGKTYLVWERGPELWTAPSSGNIVPNDRIQSGGTTVEINLGGVTVNDRADIDYLVNELARRMQLGKLWIS